MGHTFEKLSYTVFGACIAVQRQLGPHCMEMDYQRALALELSKRGLEFIREAEIPSTTTESKSLAGGSTS
jgi:GxxExxY protein